MEEKNSSNKLTIVAFLSIVALAFLVVFTNSKFQEAVGIASDSGRVAFFLGDDSMTYELPGEEMAPGDTRTFKFTVSNFKDNDVTEVATRYSIAIDDGSPANPLGTLPLTYKLYESDIAGNEVSEIKLTNLSHTSEIIPPGSIVNEKITKYYLLKITWSDTTGNRNIIYDNQLKVPRLTFKIVQVD